MDLLDLCFCSLGGDAIFVATQCTVCGQFQSGEVSGPLGSAVDGQIFRFALLGSHGFKLFMSRDDAEALKWA